MEVAKTAATGTPPYERRRLYVLLNQYVYVTEEQGLNG